jgi:hypothetical protein
MKWGGVTVGETMLSVRQLWRTYRELVSEPATRFPVLVLTVVWIGCWALIAYLLLTLGVL